MLKNHSLTKYNNLIKTVALTDFKLKYEGSALGYLWSLVKPLMLFSVLYFVFTRVFKLGANIPFYPVYLLLGIVLWNFFIESTVTSLYSIVSKGDLIRKVYFPRILLILSNSLTSLLTFLANFIIVIVFMIFNKVPLTVNVFYAPILFIEMYIFSLGVGLILGSLYVKFRDIAHIWEVVLQALFYATPILYSPLMLPGIFKKILMISPIAQILQDARWSLISQATVRSSDILPHYLIVIPYTLPLLIFGFGLWIFEKMAAQFAEEI